jgi:hypothetical protein
MRETEGRIRPGRKLGQAGDWAECRKGREGEKKRELCWVESGREREEKREIRWVGWTFSSSLFFFYLGVTEPTPLKRISSSIVRKIEEQLRVLCIKFIFSFPCSFILWMVAPLYFTHLDYFSPSDSLRCSQYFDRMLWISQVILHIEFFQW